MAGKKSIMSEHTATLTTRPKASLSTRINHLFFKFAYAFAFILLCSKIVMAAPNWQLVILPDPNYAIETERVEAHRTISQQLTIALSNNDISVLDQHILNLPDCILENCSSLTPQHIVESAKRSHIGVNLALLYHLEIVTQRDNGIENWRLTLTGKIIGLNNGAQQEAFDVSSRMQPPARDCIAECKTQWLNQRVAILAKELGAVLGEKLTYLPQSTAYKLKFENFTPTELLTLSELLQSFDGYSADTLLQDYNAKEQGMHQVVSREIRYSTSLEDSAMHSALQQAIWQLDIRAKVTYNHEQRLFIITRLGIPHITAYIAAIGITILLLSILGLMLWRQYWQKKHHKQLQKLANEGQIQAWIGYLASLNHWMCKGEWLQQKQGYLSQLAQAESCLELAHSLCKNQQYLLAQQQVRQALSFDQHNKHALYLQGILADYQRGLELLQEATVNVQLNPSLASSQLHQAKKLNPDLLVQCQTLEKQYNLDYQQETHSDSGSTHYEAHQTDPFVVPKNHTSLDNSNPRAGFNGDFFLKVILFLSLLSAAAYWFYHNHVSKPESNAEYSTLVPIVNDNALPAQDLNPNQGPLDEEELARAELKQKDLNAWQQAANIDNEDSYAFYLAHWPQGQFALRANSALKAKQHDKTLWQQDLKLNSVEAFQGYLSRQPQGDFSQLAKQKLRELYQSQLQKEKISSTVALADEYLLQQKNYREALYYYQQGAELADRYSQYQLAEMYYKGQGTAVNYPAAASWYEQAANQGHGQAQLTLGYMSSNGLGIKQSFSQAVYWYQLAAEQNLVSAQYNLAYLYAQGQGINKNYQLAAFWYQKAAEQGDADAQNNLGKLYERGLGVRVDIEKARELYRQSARQGNQMAKINLNLLH